MIQSDQGVLFGEEYRATTSDYSYTPETGPSVVKRFGWPGFTDDPREIQLDPGRHAFELYCFKALAKPGFRPTFELSVKAGYAYALKRDASDGQAAVFVNQEAPQRTTP